MRLAAALLPALMLAACAPDPAPTMPQTPTNPPAGVAQSTDPALLLPSGRDFAIAAVNGAALPANSQAILRREGGQVSGNGGCNQFFGPIRITGTTLAIGPLGATLMGCPEPLMRAEGALHAAPVELTAGERVLVTLRPAATDR